MSEDEPQTEDFMAEARAAMVQSLRRSITDERVLTAMGNVPRELFVLPERQAEAYADRALPIGHGQTISQPMMVAVMLQEMALQGTETVLDIGTGSGYQAALLSELAASVVGVELVPELTERARRTLREHGYTNVTVHQAGEELGWPEEAPYDAIVVAAASPRLPQSLVMQLAPQGRIVIPVGERTGQELIVAQNGPEGLAVTRKGRCGFVPLVAREAFTQ